MTAEMDECSVVSEVSNVEFEGKSDLNVSSSEDLPELSKHCNGTLHDSAEEVNGNTKDDTDGSYVFVNGADTISDDSVERDLDAECVIDRTEAFETDPNEKTVSDVSSSNEEKHVEVEESRVEKGENGQSFGENGCIEEIVVSSSNHNATVEVIARSDTVEVKNKIDAFETESQNLDNEVKVVEQNQLESPSQVEKYQESQFLVREAVECETQLLDNGEEKVEDQINQESAAEVEQSRESQTEVTVDVEVEPHQHGNGEQKSEEQIKLESSTGIEGIQEFQVMVTKDVESEMDQENECMKVADVITMEITTCPLNNEPSETVGNCSDENGESFPSPVEAIASETQVIKDSADSDQSMAALGSVKNALSLSCPVSELKSDTEARFISTESGDTLPTSPVVGNGSVLFIESFPTSAVDGSRSEAEVRKFDSSDTVPFCPADDPEPETEVSHGSGEGGQSMPRCPADDVKLETKIGSGSIGCVETVPTYPSDDVKIESECVNGSDKSGCSVSTLAVVDIKLESVGNVSVASSMDMPGDDAAKSEDVPYGSGRNRESQLNCPNDVLDVENEEDQSITRGSDDKPICQDAESIEGIHRDEISPSSSEGSTTGALDGQKVEEELLKMPFPCLIRIPRYVGDKIREQIRIAQLQVDEKTQSRDAIRVAIQRKRVTFNEYRDNFEAAKSELRAAREAVNSKRQEIDSVQIVINRIKNATSIEDIDGRLLKSELDSLRNKVLQTEVITNTTKKKYFDENEKLKELQAQFKAADNLRQEAYTHLQNLRKELYDKNKYFRMYSDATKAANDYASAGDKEALQCLCVNQVEKIMELWNNNDEFRNEYIRCNKISTLKRLRTMDGRALGPDEEPPVLCNVVDERVNNAILTSSTSDLLLPVSTPEQEKLDVPVGHEIAGAKSMARVEQKNQTAKPKKPTIPTALENNSATVCEKDKTEEEKEEHKRRKEEDELARKADELKKEEVAIKLKEQHRLEEKAKAKEAKERKKRNAEKAQVRAELRAQKEAELKEKERVKRAKKKERKNAAVVEATNGSNEGESAPSSENTPTETTLEPETEEKPTTVARRLQKPSLKQTKTKPPPLSLRNKGRRRMQPWIWVLMALLVLALFLVGNSGFSSSFGLPSFGF
ncbi:hypothetical protein HHK36_002376 [Tetracentron sinense]|uniref:Uncharacterized protein n=1 Tax=Tetracentron sinense TaxID=13715 RepID=A0A835DMP9_TETSI|nr:hypothetical protein HHK36_002376 [Tetracentron sinense]